MPPRSNRSNESPRTERLPRDGVRSRSRDDAPPTAAPRPITPERLAELAHRLDPPRPVAGEGGPLTFTDEGDAEEQDAPRGPASKRPHLHLDGAAGAGKGAPLRGVSDVEWLEPTDALAPVESPSRQALFQLVVSVDGFPIGRHVFSHGLVRLGRDEDCDLTLDDALCSRAHALIERARDGGFVVHDQQSSNGTKVNGVRVERPRRLADGDVVLVGRTSLVFKTDLVGSTDHGSDDGEGPQARAHKKPIPVLPNRPRPSERLGKRPLPPTEKHPQPDGAPAPPGAPGDRPAPAPAQGASPPAPAAPAPAAPVPAPAPPASMLAAQAAIAAQQALQAAQAGASGRHRCPPPQPAPGTSGRFARAVHAAQTAPTEPLPLAPPPPPAPAAPATARLARPTPPGGDPAASTLPPGAINDEDVFGQTLILQPRRVENDLRETSLPERAFLRETAAERWSAAQTGQAEAVHVIDRDVILIGGGADADVKIGNVLTPRVVAVLVRGHGGFSMNQVAGWPWQARVNGRVVSDREPLEEGDVITVGGRAFTFHRGQVRDL